MALSKHNIFTVEQLVAAGFVEGVDFYVNHSGRILAIKANKPRKCPKCGEKKAPFYSALHTQCRACQRREARGILSGTPEAMALDMCKLGQRKTRGTLTAADLLKTEEDIRRRAVSAHQKELASRILARRRLLQFIKKFQPGYMDGWVHHDICRRLERFLIAVAEGKSPRMLLFCPPRLGKSLIASQYFPAWMLGQFPQFEIIAASYNISLPTGFSRRIRELVRDKEFTALFPECVLSEESQAVESWRTTLGGGYTAAGVGTGITGKGCHVLIVDDPVKDQEAADSANIREATWEWYLSTAYTRIAPGGGVLGIQCMTGDTPVLMADGTERRLDALSPLDEVATYENGALCTSYVEAVRSNGRDDVLRITTSSGRVVRANGRHPFLTIAPTGELVWTRARSLTTAHRIVTVKDSGASGAELHALWKAASSQPRAEACATRTTVSSAGPTSTAQRATVLKHDATPTSNTATASLLRSTMRFMYSKVAAALSAGVTRALAALPSIGGTSSPSITATKQAQCAGCCATTAISPSDTLELSKWHLPLPGISDFTLEAVASIEEDGVEEVFDVQIARTENFIANGLVSHNTRWNDDDWSGRIIMAMDTGEGEQFEVVSYPAINESGDEYLMPDDTIRQLPEGVEAPEGAQLLRTKGSALHPDRYDIAHLQRIKKNFIAAGNTRMWSALYQQNPVPEEGAFFRKDMFRYVSYMPDLTNMHVYQAWDFSITEKESSDWIVGYCLAQDEFDNVYELDMVRFKSDENAFTIADAIIDFYQKWPVWIVGFEDGQIWKSIKAVVMRRAEEKRIAMNYETLVPMSDKLVRAGPLRGRMQMGKMYFQQNAHFRQTVDSELLRFPGGKHDDIVDAAAWATRLVLSHQPPAAKKTYKPPKSWKDKLGKRPKGDSYMAA